MIDGRIKELRQQAHMTQSELAKRLGITRSSVNAWELGISIPSTQYLVELSHLFKVSTDFLLGLNNASAIDMSGLTDADSAIVYALVRHLAQKNSDT